MECTINPTSGGLCAISFRYISIWPSREGLKAAGETALGSLRMRTPPVVENGFRFGYIAECPFTSRCD